MDQRFRDHKKTTKGLIVSLNEGKYMRLRHLYSALALTLSYLCLHYTAVADNGVARTHVVGSSARLNAILDGVSPGDTVLLEWGNYERIKLSGFRPPEVITFRAADPERRPTIGSLELKATSNVRFYQLAFHRYTAQADTSRTQVVTVKSSQNISFEDCEFYGFRDGNFDNDPRGLLVTHSRAITLADSRLHDLMKGAIFVGSEALRISNNRLEDIRSDGLNFAGVRDVRIANNYLTDFHPNLSRGDHPDYIQFWTRGTDRETTDVVIIGNVLLQGQGAESQSIFIGNEKRNWYYRNFRIERNLIYQSHFHGISAYGLVGATIARNTIVAFPGASMQPGINLFGTRSVAVSRNVTPLIRRKGDHDTRLDRNVLASEAYIWSSRRPTNLFVDPSAGPRATRESFYPKPGGPLDRGEAAGALRRPDPS